MSPTNQQKSKRAVSEIKDHNSWGKETAMKNPGKRVTKPTEKALAAAKNKAKDEATEEVVAASLSEGADLNSVIDLVSPDKPKANETATEGVEENKEDDIEENNDNDLDDEDEDKTIILEPDDLDGEEKTIPEKNEGLEAKSNDDDLKGEDKTILEKNEGLEAESKGFDANENNDDDNDPEDAVDPDLNLELSKLKNNICKAEQLKLELTEELRASYEENAKLSNAVQRLESLRDEDQTKIGLLGEEILQLRDDILQLREEIRNRDVSAARAIQQLNHMMDHLLQNMITANNNGSDNGASPDGDQNGPVFVETVPTDDDSDL